VTCYGVGRNTDRELRFLEPRRRPTVDEATIVYPVEYSLSSREKNEIVFLGDSACTDGIDPAKLRVPSYNLGTAGGLGTAGYEIILRAYLGGHPKPRLVVLCLSIGASRSRVAFHCPARRPAAWR
jgi:hypothetical protein